jgi:hypothetical protein
LRLRCRKPTSKDLAEDFNRVRDWIAELEAGSRKARGYGYHIEWRTIRHRVHGSNDLPAAIEIPSLDDAVRLIGKQRELAKLPATGCRLDRPNTPNWPTGSRPTRCARWNIGTTGRGCVPCSNTSAPGPDPPCTCASSRLRVSTASSSKPIAD